MTYDPKIIAIANATPLHAYDWPGRGPAPAAYYRGMAVGFALAYLMLKQPDPKPNPLGTATGDKAAWAAGKAAVAIAAAEATRKTSTDVLAWYRNELKAAGAVLTSPGERLIAIFAIMLGLGMRESSGAYCTGADTPKSRGEPTTEDNAEAGLFQVSHDSIDGDAQRQSAFDAFKGRADLLDLFGDHVTCKPADGINHGNGAGASFQKNMKGCPLFSILYTAGFLRQERAHWGPINTRAAEAKTDAVAMFRAIAAVIDA